MDTISHCLYVCAGFHPRGQKLVPIEERLAASRRLHDPFTITCIKANETLTAHAILALSSMMSAHGAGADRLQAAAIGAAAELGLTIHLVPALAGLLFIAESPETLRVAASACSDMLPEPTTTDTEGGIPRAAIVTWLLRPVECALKLTSERGTKYQPAAAALTKLMTALRRDEGDDR